MCLMCHIDLLSSVEDTPTVVILSLNGNLSGVWESRGKGEMKVIDCKRYKGKGEQMR